MFLCWRLSLTRLIPVEKIFSQCVDSNRIYEFTFFPFFLLSFPTYYLTHLLAFFPPFSLLHFFLIPYLSFEVRIRISNVFLGCDRIRIYSRKELCVGASFGARVPFLFPYKAIRFHRLNLWRTRTKGPRFFSFLFYRSSILCLLLSTYPSTLRTLRLGKCCDFRIFEKRDPGKIM